jgi:hypothetical protein
MNMSILIKKTGRLVDFDVESLPPQSMEYAIRNGLTQRLNDVHASVKRIDFADDDAYIAAVHAKVDHAYEQFITGNVPGARAAADPKAAVVRKLVATLQSKGMTLDQIVAFVETKMAA